MSENNEIFTDGLHPGAPAYDFEIKFLICYLLNQANEPVSFHQLAVTFQKTGFVNYFVFADLISEMLRQGHIRPAEGGVLSYVITSFGAETARQFEKNIPYTVRERCGKELARQLTIGRRLRENTVNIREAEDGFVVTLEIPDIHSPLLNLSLSLPTREHCEEVKKRFLNDPLVFYRGVMALATGDLETVGKLVESGENLFE